MSKVEKNKSSTPIVIIIGSLVLTFVLANPVFFFVGIFIVWLFSDKFGKKYRK